MGINILEQLYVSLIESRMMTGIEIWGLDDGWREIGKVHEMFCKRIRGHQQQPPMCEGIGKDK
jgi:hypothetical protein